MSTQDTTLPPLPEQERAEFEAWYAALPNNGRKAGLTLLDAWQARAAIAAQAQQPSPRMESMAEWSRNYLTNHEGEDGNCSVQAPRTEFVLTELKSALNGMLTFFGMDEDENSKAVFDKARQAYDYAQIVMRPLEPWERESLRMFRECLSRWHEKAVAKGFDGVDAMCDLAASQQAQQAQGVPQDARKLLHIAQLAAAPQAEPQPEREPLTDAQIEKLREQTFSTSNPFCPCDSKTMRKAVWAAERAHGIGTKGGDKP